MKLLVALLALGVGTSAHSDEERRCVGVDGPANVRESGHAMAKIIASIPKGSTVVTMSKTGAWYKVEFFRPSQLAMCSTDDPLADYDKAKMGWLHEKNVLHLKTTELFRLDPCGTNTGKWEGVSRGLTATTTAHCICSNTHYGDGGSYCGDANKVKGAVLGTDCARLGDFVKCSTWDGAWGDDDTCLASCVSTKKTEMKKTKNLKPKVQD